MKTITLPHSTLSVRALLLVLGAAAALPAQPALATDGTWTTATSGSWTTTAAWSAGTVAGAASPSTTDPGTATFTNAANVTVTVDSGRNVKNISFTGSDGAFTLSGGSLVLTSGGTIQTTGTGKATTSETVNTPLTLEGNYTFTAGYATTTALLAFGSSATITNGATSTPVTLTLNGTNTGANSIAGVISDGSGTSTTAVTKSGTGSWTLTGTNTYSGSTIVNQGGLVLGGTGSVANSVITLGVQGSGLAPTLTITPTAAGSTTRSSGLTSNGGAITTDFTVNGTSAGNTTESFGALTLNAGQLVASLAPNAASHLEVDFSSFTRNPGGFLYLGRSTTAPGTATNASATAGTTNIMFSTAPTLSGNGGATGSANVSVLVGADVNLDLATYDPTYGVRALNTTTEMVVLASGLSLGTGSAGQNVKINSSTSVTLNTDTRVNSYYAAGTGQVLFNSDSRKFSVTSGAIDATATTAIGSGTTGGNGILDFGSAEGVLFVENSRVLTVNSVISGSGGLTLGTNQSGQAVFTNANTYTGTTTLAGLLHLTNSLALQNTTLDYNNYGGSFTFGNGTTTGQTAYTFGGLKGAQNITLANNNTTVGAVALTVGGDNDSTTYSGVLSDGTTAGGALTKTGTGTLTLTNTNTYTGGTTVSAGKLLVNGGTAGSSTASGVGSGAVVVNSGGTLAGSGNIAASSVAIHSGGTLSSGGVQSGTTVTGTGMSLTNVTATVSSATLTFTLGAGTTAGSGAYNFATPNTNTTYLKLAGSTTMNFSGSDSIALIDLTGGGLSALRLSTPYLLASAGSNADYLNLVIQTGTGAGAVYSLSQNDALVNGYVLGVATGVGTLGSAGSYTPIAITQYGADGVTPLTGSAIYAAPALYLNAGSLEVVPEPGTWALMLGGVALLLLIQRRKGNG